MGLYVNAVKTLLSLLCCETHM